MYQEQWILKKRYFDPLAFQQDRISPIMGEILSRRELYSKDQVNDFLNPKDLGHDPFLLHGMNDAVERLLFFRQQKQKILVALDYDVDGIASGAILFHAFQQLGFQFECIFPHRSIDGYGLNDRMVEYARANGFRCILTFDNGISAFDSVSLAKSFGMTVIVTDHHAVPQEMVDGGTSDRLVDADVIINPWKQSCSYPYKGICGAMIAYKMMQAIAIAMECDPRDIAYLESLAAIATICDVMELKDENRWYVRNALQFMNKTPLVGLRALLEQTGIAQKNSITAQDIGFQIGPILNAAGRLRDADFAFALLTTSDYEEAVCKAKQLIELNNERKTLTKNAVALAKRQMEQEKLTDSNAIVLLLDGVHESIAGIVAGRIKEEYEATTMIFTASGDILKGSARATEGINLYEVLSQFKDHFVKFGGHAAAAGFSMNPESFSAFRSEIMSYFDSLTITRNRVFAVDAIIPLSDTSRSLAKDMELFEPTGNGNPPILLASRGLKLVRLDLLGSKKNVLRVDFEAEGCHRKFVSFVPDIILKKIKSKLKIQDTHDIIELDLSKNPNATFDVLYKISISPFQNQEYLNLEIVSVR